MDMRRRCVSKRKKASQNGFRQHHKKWSDVDGVSGMLTMFQSAVHQVLTGIATGMGLLLCIAGHGLHKNGNSAPQATTETRTLRELTRLNRIWGLADLSARRTFGRPKVRFNPSPPPCLRRKNGRKSGRTFGRPKVRFNPSPPLVLIPPYTNNPPPPPYTNNKTPAVATDRLLCVQPCVHRLVCAPPSLCTSLPVAPSIT